VVVGGADVVEDAVRPLLEVVGAAVVADVVTPVAEAT